MENNEDEAIKTEIQNISMNIDRILQKLAEYGQPAQVETEQAPEKLE